MAISNKLFSRIILVSVICLIALYVGLFICVCLCKYFNFGYIDWDLAIYNQIFRGILNGKPHISLLDVPILGSHVEITMLLLIPLYALFPHPVTLLVIQSIMLGLAAIPLFLIVRGKLNNLWAFLFVIIYLLYPPVGYTNLNEFHPESFLPFIQFFMFYFFIRNDFKKFMILMFLCLFAKENMALILIMLGFYALLNRKGKKWVTLPILSGMIWFLFYLKIIAPNLTQGKIGFYNMYEHLGSNFEQIIWTIITHPIQILKFMITSYRLFYLVKLFAPLSFLPVLSPSLLLITLPYFFQHFLSSRIHELSLYFYYPSEILAIIFISAVYGISFLSKMRFFVRNNKILYIIVPAVALYFSALLGPQFYILYAMKHACRKTGMEVAKNKLIDIVPKGSKVVATFEFFPKLSNITDEIYSFHRVTTGTYQLSDMKFTLPEDTEFALINFDDLYTFYNLFPPVYGKQNLSNFFAGNNWTPIECVENTVLFKKNHNSNMPLYELMRSTPQEGLKNIAFDGTIGLISYKAEKEFLRNRDKLHITLFWRANKKTDLDYSLFSVFLDRDSKIVYSTKHPLCYRIYSTDMWKEGEIIREEYWIFVPTYINKGNYQIGIGLFDSSTGRVCMVSSDGIKLRDAHWINLAEFQVR